MKPMGKMDYTEWKERMDKAIEKGNLTTINYLWSKLPEIEENGYFIYLI